MKHLVIPAEFRTEYKHRAASIYSMICGDCPEVERYSDKAVIEIVRDANRISAHHYHRAVPAFDAWIKVHEYDQEYRRDMNRAVKEAIYG